MQQEYFPGRAIPIVFHATDIRSGKDIFRTLSPERRERLLEDLYSIILDIRFPNAAVFSAIIGADAAKNTYQDRSSVFEEVISGFNSFLVIQRRLQLDHKGLVIIDKYREEQYKQLLDTFREEGTKYGYVANIVDIPYFARCRDTPMLQFADLCAYALFRFYEKQDDRYFKKVLPRIYRTPDGKLFGLKHITTNRKCDCPACAFQKTL